MAQSRGFATGRRAYDRIRHPGSATASAPIQAGRPVADARDLPQHSGRIHLCRAAVRVCAPGSNRWENLAVLKPADQIKFVIASRRDFDWTAQTIRTHALDGRFTVLLSPVFGAVTPLDLATWLLESRLPVRMQLQMHKYIW